MFDEFGLRRSNGKIRMDDVRSQRAWDRQQEEGGAGKGLRNTQAGKALWIADGQR